MGRYQESYQCVEGRIPIPIPSYLSSSDTFPSTAILAAIVFTVISVVTLTSDGAKAAPPPPPALPPFTEEKRYKDTGSGDDPINLREGDEEAMIRIRGLEGLRV